MFCEAVDVDDEAPVEIAGSSAPPAPTPAAKSSAACPSSVADPSRAQASLWGDKQQTELDVALAGLAAVNAQPGGRKSKAAEFLNEQVRSLRKLKAKSTDNCASTWSLNFLNALLLKLATLVCV